jgi:hypothetical protein
MENLNGIKTRYVAQLSPEAQALTRELLEMEGLNEDDIEVAMDSRLCDLTDTINVNDVISAELSVAFMKVEQAFIEASDRDERLELFRIKRAIELKIEAIAEGITPAFWAVETLTEVNR